MRNYTNARTCGLATAVALFIAVMLPWLMVSVPFYGSFSASGMKTDDGKVVLGLAIALGVLALITPVVVWADAHLWVWHVVGGLVTVAAAYDIIHVASYSFVDSHDNAISRSLEKSMQATVGPGLYLVLMIGLALLILPWILQAIATPVVDTEAVL